MPLLKATLRRLPLSPEESLAELQRRIEAMSQEAPDAAHTRTRAAVIEALRTRRPQERRR